MGCQLGYFTKPTGDDVQGLVHLAPADRFKIEMNVGDAEPADFDGLVLPGGGANPDMLRMRREAIDFIRDFDAEDKRAPPSATGSHLTNAGAEWPDEPVVLDARLVTSRKPDDLPAFNDMLPKELLVAPGTDPGPTS